MSEFELFAGRFEIVREIGAGGMGSVFLARDAKLDRHVALKAIRSAAFQTLPHDELLARFAREARTAASVQHKNVVTVFDFFDDPSGPVIVMEFVEGETLAAALAASGTLPVERAVWVVSNIADGLAAAHAKGLVHRDLKPANVMLLRDGGVKILDFGVAKNVADTLTRDGSVFGTLNYMAPEQMRGQASASSDIFTLGAIAFEILTGRKAFAGDEVTEVMYRVLNEEPAYELPDGGSLSPEIVAVLRRVMAKDPNARYRTATEFAEDLSRAAGLIVTPSGRVMSARRSASTASNTSAGSTDPAPRSRRSWLIATGGAGVLAAAAILAVVLWPRHDRTASAQPPRAAVEAPAPTPTPGTIAQAGRTVADSAVVSPAVDSTRAPRQATPRTTDEYIGDVAQRIRSHFTPAPAAGGNGAGAPSTSFELRLDASGAVSSLSAPDDAAAPYAKAAREAIDRAGPFAKLPDGASSLALRIAFSGADVRVKRAPKAAAKCQKGDIVLFDAKC